MTAKFNAHAQFMTRGGMSLEECAQVMGVTRERVRQIEEMALCKLRNMAVYHPDLQKYRQYWEDLE